MSGCSNCSKSCSQPVLISDQDGVLYPVVDGRVRIPNYGDHPQIRVKADPCSPLRVDCDPADPYSFTIFWDAEFTATNELVSADGKKVLFKVETVNPRIVGVNGVKTWAPSNGDTTFVGLNIDDSNPPALTIAEDGQISA